MSAVTAPRSWAHTSRGVLEGEGGVAHGAVVPVLLLLLYAGQHGTIRDDGRLLPAMPIVHCEEGMARQPRDLRLAGVLVLHLRAVPLPAHNPQHPQQQLASNSRQSPRPHRSFTLTPCRVNAQRTASATLMAQALSKDPFSIAIVTDIEQLVNAWEARRRTRRAGKKRGRGSAERGGRSHSGRWCGRARGVAQSSSINMKGETATLKLKIKLKIKLKLRDQDQAQDHDPDHDQDQDVDEDADQALKLRDQDEDGGGDDEGGR